MSVRATSLAGLLTALFVCPAAAQDGFDATGQVFFSIDLSVTGKKESEPRFGVRFGSTDMPEPTDSRLDSQYEAFSLQLDAKGNKAVSVGDARFNLQDDVEGESMTMSPSSDLLYPARGAGSQFDSKTAPQAPEPDNGFVFRLESLEVSTQDGLASSKALQPVLSPTPEKLSLRADPEVLFNDTRDWTEAGP